MVPRGQHEERRDGQEGPGDRPAPWRRKEPGEGRQPPGLVSPPPAPPHLIPLAEHAAAGPSAAAGSREPGAGSRKPEAGSRKPEAGSRKPEAGSRKPEAGSRKPEARMPMLERPCKTHSDGAFEEPTAAAQGACLQRLRRARRAAPDPGRARATRVVSGLSRKPRTTAEPRPTSPSRPPGGGGSGAARAGRPGGREKLQVQRNTAVRQRVSCAPRVPQGAEALRGLRHARRAAGAQDPSARRAFRRAGAGRHMPSASL